MPRRRTSISPQREIEVLRDEINMLRREIQMIRQPGPVSLQAEDMGYTLSPAPWQTQINPGAVHTPAVSTDPVVYYHPGDDIVDAGFKRTGLPVPPTPWIRRGANFGQNFVIQGDNLTDGEEILYYTATEGSDDANDYFVMTGINAITSALPRQSGIYEVMVELVFTDQPIDGPAWFRIHDGEGWATGMGGDPRPGYGQLGATTSGLWRGRHRGGKAFQVDVQQISGSPATADAWYVETHYIGPYTGPDRDESTVWPQ